MSDDPFSLHENTISAGPDTTDRENQEVWQTERDRRRNRLVKTHVGVVAQDVEAVLPEAVTTDADGLQIGALRQSDSAAD
jgi:hypothetical protein